IAYNKSIVNDPYSNEVVKVTGSDQKSVGLDTQALAILYDVSGAKTPNSYGTNKDIRGLNIAIKTGADIVNLGTTYSAVDCSTTASTSTDATIKSNYDTYCGSEPSGYSEDYWAGAQKACADIGMSLPDHVGTPGKTCPTNAAENTLCGIYNNRDEYGITSGKFWSSSEGVIGYAFSVSFASGGVTNYSKNSRGGVVCIGN
ncbi:hypothetical protein IJZ97_06660, partial [bacterium]|nr:hypothetical protein [bacterium]